MHYRLYLLLFIGLLSSCAHQPTENYSTLAAVQPHREAKKSVHKKIRHYKVSAPLKTGKPHFVNAHGFKTVVYDAHAKATIQCAPLHLCVMQLEQGEMINNIELGDTENWLIDTAMMGTREAHAYHITLKPKVTGIATDMVVSTTRRTYHIDLVSESGAKSEILHFHYPKKTLRRTLEKTHRLQARHASHTPFIDRQHLNVHYAIKGFHAPWFPVRVFDDGTKTFIELPPLAERFDLPVFYLKTRHRYQLVNSRYRRPYMIVDSLFKQAVLIVGKGRSRQVVTLINQHLS